MCGVIYILLLRPIYIFHKMVGTVESESVKEAPKDYNSITMYHRYSEILLVN